MSVLINKGGLNMVKKGNVRLIVTLDKEHLIMLDNVCKLLKTKQRSKAIKFLLQSYFTILLK